MGKRVLQIVILTILCVCFAVGFTACNNESKDKMEAQIKSVYNTYVVYAEANGITPKTYEEWLATIKGEKGDKGDKGDKGEDGITPTIEISEDGYWVINGIKTKYKAVANNGTSDNHTHTYVETEVAATCTARGGILHTCECGDKYMTEETPVLGHDYGEWTLTKEPTCTKAGEYTRYCSRDNKHKDTKTEPALGHDYTSVVTPPTYTEQGYTTYTCSRCGNSYIGDYVDALITDPAFIVEKVNTTAGKKGVAVKVSVKNNPGISSIALSVSYDAGLTLTGFEYNGSIGGQSTPYNANVADVKLVWVNWSADVSGDWVFATLYFDVATGASGKYNVSVSYDAEDIYNVNEENIHFEIINGGIEIK